MHREKNRIAYHYFLMTVTAIVLAGLLSSSFSPGKRLVVTSLKNISNGDTTIVDTLAAHFKNPPPEYSLFPFWSLNNTLDSAKLNWQTDQMIDKGVYGAFMHAREGLDESATPYFSDGWWNAIASTVKHAHEKGFFTGLYDEDKWPSGSAGGRTIRANPERNIKKIMRYSDFEVPGAQTMQLNFPYDPMAIFAGKISDRGVYDFSSQQDLTPLLGKDWKVPPGKWAIIVFTLIKDPQEQINYMDSTSVADFIHITHDEYYKRLGKYFGNTIPGVFFDEIYANSSDRNNNIFWTDDFLQKFKKIKGYDLRPYLPLMIFNDPKYSSIARYDFFDVVRNLYSKAWFKQYAQWTNEHHIWVTGHTTEELIQYIRQSDYFYTEGQLQRPCTDNEDFRYGNPREIDWFNPKQISSVGRNYGKSRVAAESMGSGGYTIPLEEYRYGFSMLGVYGVNMFIPHLFHYSMDRPENQADWPPSWFYQNPYWKYFKPLATYAQRISYMLSQGKYNCKVAIAYPLTELWLGGYATPVNDEYYKEVQRQLLEHHIDYDIVDPYSLSVAVSDSNGLQVGKNHYKVLILPALKAIQTEAMKKINAFISKGGIVIGLNQLPSASEKGTPADPFIIKSMTDIFGFEPNDLRQDQYHTWDKERKYHYTLKSNTAGGKGIFTRYVEQLTDIIHDQITPDILVEGAQNDWLQYQHRTIAGKEVFFLVNSHKVANSFKISFENIGKPYLWNPETGAISEVSNYRVYNNRLEMQLDFKPWESYFIVIEPGQIKSNNVLVSSVDLEDVRLMQKNDSVTINGWSSGNSSHQINFLNGNTLVSKKWRGTSSLPEIPLMGNWQFQLCPDALNYKWSPSVISDTLAIPVMNFKAGNNQQWKNIKVEDQFSSIKGCARYLSSWQASWISYYDYSMHLSPLGGGTVYFRKNIVANGAVKDASLDITADEAYELFINGKLVGKNANWKNVDHYSITDFIISGTNTILVKTSNTKGLLLEGAVTLKNNNTILLMTDTTWQASKDKVNWLPALLYAAPPLGHWGDIERPSHKLHFPLTVWYRQALPPGVEAIIKPSVKGRYYIFINDHLIKFNDQGIARINQFLRQDSNILSIKVHVKDYNDGLQKPVKFICSKASVPLRSWGDMNLGWYSGRALYTHSVQISEQYFKPETKMILDLGKVDYFAEIWVNDRLVCYRPWTPFNADITKYVHQGENKITIAVANLLANQASWDMMDANIDNKDARWWNFGSIVREKEKLTSGLLGPVKIILYVRDSIQIAIKDIQ
ncbi:hypothetical protein FW778_03905 [Ginsengibacter hankyongi]|uniref:Glycosyl hydrolases family 2 sugar binding domain-containing protein n=1 Tax=Ginsengibacter hankyongi TaxID=2607284 RepID=A0A5J5IJH0_9BACT|nr:glycosyl hydrolase [Ginsengibacter hankyongi]KAA9041189.1 hypothetical protein FW778_03905 [Ginsengibacter hankyongi]